jgi:hypothetical protein
MERHTASGCVLPKSSLQPVTEGGDSSDAPFADLPDYKAGLNREK